MLTLRRSALGGTLVALNLVIAAPAAAQGVSPTISFDAPCYSQGDVMSFEGAGYTPDGPVNLLFGANGRLGIYETAATSNGSIADSIDAPDPYDFLADDEFATDMFVTANDQTRLDAGAQPPESAFGMTQFRLSLWGVAWRSPSGRLAPGRKVAFRAVGFTHAVGNELYVHYRLGRRTLKSVRLGVLTRPCGDLRTRLMRAFPFRVRPGTYKLIFNNSPRAMAAGPRIESAPVRVSARDVRRARARAAVAERPSEWTFRRGAGR